MCMLSEDEVRNWREREHERLCCIRDPIDWRNARIAVAVLDGVLND